MMHLISDVKPLAFFLGGVVFSVALGCALSGTTLAGGGNSDKKALLKTSDSEDDPPLNPVINQDRGQCITVGSGAYQVTHSGDVPVTTQRQLLGRHFSEVSYDGLVARDFPPGSYLKTPLRFTTVDHQYKREHDYTTELWLFPNGVDSPGKRGRVLALIHNTAHQGEEKMTPFCTPVIKTSGPDARLESTALFATITHYHPKPEKSVSFALALGDDQRGFFDFGRSEHWNNFTDRYGRNSFRLTVTSEVFVQKQPGAGCQFNFEVPSGLFAMIRQGVGQLTPEGRALRGVVQSPWFDVDGQLLAIHVGISGAWLETSIGTPGGATLRNIQKETLPGQEENDKSRPCLQSSPDLRQPTGRTDPGELRKNIDKFLSRHNVEIFWSAPSGERHLIGHFHQWDRLGLAESSNFTRKYSSKVKYGRFIGDLGGGSALFHILVSPSATSPATAQGSKHVRLPRTQQNVLELQSVQPMPTLTGEFRQLYLPSEPLPANQKVRAAHQ